MLVRNNCFLTNENIYTNAWMYISADNWLHFSSIVQVYGWGCARYGQVGVGTTHSYSRPMLIEALARETCVGVDCGHYHTLVLTAGSQ